MPLRIAKATVQLGFELSHTGALDAAQKEIQTGVSSYETLLKPGAQTDAIRDLAQSRFRLGIVQAMHGDFAGANATFQQAREALAPLPRPILRTSFIMSMS